PVVEGLYTAKGHREVLNRIQCAEDYIEAHEWVVPSGAEERGVLLRSNLHRLYDEYAAHQVQQWTAWLQDVVVRPRTSDDEMFTLYRSLVRHDWPYLRLLHAVEYALPWPYPGRPGPGWPCRSGRPAGRWTDGQIAAFWLQITGHSQTPLAE